jgi:RNA polymerase sigma-70 factor (ECF subfamily)
MTQRERHWIEAVQCGDERAFRHIFDVYYEDLCRFAIKYVDSKEQTEDLVQDVFLNIWERRDAWTVRQSLKAYLYRAVRNRALNHIRRRGTVQNAKVHVRHLLEETASVPTASDSLREKELHEAAEDAINQLPERRRTAFLLHRRNDFTYKEVAEIMEITPKTVENHIGRALKTLRKKLKPFLSRELTG